MTGPDSPLPCWGFDARWAAAAAAVDEPGEPGRVIAADRGLLTVALDGRTVRAVWRPADPDLRDDPSAITVGDWCVARAPERTDDQSPAVVHTALPRRSVLARRAAGRATARQVLAANVDLALIVCGLDRDQGIRSLERLLTVVLDGGAMPLVVLNKADLCDEIDQELQRARMAAPGFEALAISAATGEGLSRLRPWLVPGTTAALLGPSGAGKSTLINTLAGRAVARTAAVRDGDRRGRHTTVRRQLFAIDGGALLLDTPGLRHLGAWLDGDGLRRAFADIDQLAAGCRFRDCTHGDEPGCAVRAALMDGTLEPRRFWRYLDLAAEAVAQRRARDVSQGANSKRRFKNISRRKRQMDKLRDGSK